MDTEKILVKDRMLDPSKIKVVPIDQVRPNTWNPKDKDTKEYEQIVKSVTAHGLMTFIPVRNNSIENSPYEIIDGEQRWRACKELGYQTIAIYDEGIVEQKRAEELTIWWQVQVQFNDLSLAKLVVAHIEQYNDYVLPFSEETIEQMRKVAKFDFSTYKKNAETPPPPQGELLKSFMLQLTSSQYDIVQQALEKAKKASGADITDSKALEFVCAEYINAIEGTVS